MSILGDRIAKRLTAIGKSQVELGRATGMKQQSINSIVAGDVERPRKLREIAAFLQTTQEYLLGETNDPSPPPASANVAVVPLISWVSAGRLTDMEAPIPTDDMPPVATDGLGRGDFFGLRVQGDSMDRVSPDGSVIIVNRRERTLVSGKPYVFAVRGQTTYKLWHPKPLYLAPYSTNPLNEPIFVDKKRDLEVIGRVRRTILDL